MEISWYASGATCDNNMVYKKYILYIYISFQKTLKF